MPNCKLLGKVIAKTEVNKRIQSFLFTFSLLVVGRCFLLLVFRIVLYFKKILLDNQLFTCRNLPKWRVPCFK